MEMYLDFVILFLCVGVIKDPFKLIPNKSLANERIH